MDPLIPPTPGDGGGEAVSPCARGPNPPATQPLLARLRLAGARVSGAVEHHNPFYLLSAACMLGGCLLLTNSLSWSPIAFPRLIALFITLNLYELLLLGLGLYLVRLNGHPLKHRDAGQLLVLGAVFMADAAFLVSEIVSTRLALGSVLSGGLFVAALIKAAVIARVLGVPMNPGRWAAIALTFAALFGIPVWLKSVGDTRVTGGHLYAAWWAAAVVWAVFDVVSRRDEAARALAPPRGRTPFPMDVLFVVVPFLSLVAHLGILHYVYDRAFTGTHVAPLMLVGMLALARMEVPAGTEIAKLRRVLLAALPLGAVYVSFRGRPEMALALHSSLVLTPGMLGLVGAYLASAWVFLPGARFAGAVVLGVLGAATYLFGPSWSQVSGVGARLWTELASAASFVASAARSIASVAWSVVPRSASAWGAVAVVASFVLLAVGARVSLKRRLPPPDVDPQLRTSV